MPKTVSLSLSPLFLSVALVPSVALSLRGSLSRSLCPSGSLPCRAIKALTASCTSKQRWDKIRDIFGGGQGSTRDREAGKEEEGSGEEGTGRGKMGTGRGKKQKGRGMGGGGGREKVKGGEKRRGRITVQ